ncbi:hypothetical protein JCM2811A_29940 [Methylorubrum rhodinum]
MSVLERPPTTLPAGVHPRMLSCEQAAEYCGCTLSTFDEWRRREIVPGPMPGTTRWDRRAIDRAVDRRSGLAPLDEPDIDEWLAENTKPKHAR